ncbi:MAG: ATP-binding protein [Oligosphaeraceae bacterium]
MAGLLILGTEPLLRRHLSTHEVAFQVLSGTAVRKNLFSRRPLLEVFEDVTRDFEAQVSEEELSVGLFRVPVPNYDLNAFREAFVNALVHRDYNMLGTVQVQLDDQGLTISSPGGFVEGVSTGNLLVAQPRSRNPLLADIIKRIGLAERTGRGIDRIYEGLLRYGRPMPDYSASDSMHVSVFLSSCSADLAFMRMHLTAQGRPLPLDELIILSALLPGRRLSVAELRESVQKGERSVQSSAEELVELGLVVPHGTGRARTYRLSAKMYAKAVSGRQACLTRQRQEQVVLGFLDEHGSVRRSEVMELCRLSADQATRLLVSLTHDHGLVREGRGGGTRYRLPEG